MIKLEKIALRLKATYEENLYQQIETAITPLKRDAQHIHKKMRTSKTAHDHDIINRCNRLAEKAKLWLALEERLDDHSAVMETIITHHFHEAEALIKQDLEIIANYQAHSLANLKLSDSDRLRLGELLQKKIAFHIQELHKLKKKPKLLELHKIALWKSEMAKQRNLHFDRALHKIDTLVEQNATPVPVFDE